MALEHRRDAGVPGARIRRLQLVDEHAPDERVREAVATAPALGLDQDAVAHRALEVVGGRGRRRPSARTAASIVSPRSAATSSVARQSSPSRARRRAITSRTPCGTRLEPARSARRAGGRSRRRRTGCRWSRGGAPRRAPPTSRRVPVDAIQRAQCSGERPPSSSRRVDGSRASARQRGGERIVALHLGVAIGRDDEETRVGEIGRDELEQLQRGAVGPVQVVEHDDEPGRLRDRGEEAADDVEEAEARAIRLRALARPGAPGMRSRSTGNTWASSAPHGPTAAATASRPDVIDPAPERGVPRPEGGRRAVLPAASPPDRDTARLGLGGEYAREARLADARLAREQHHPAAPVEALVRAARSSASSCSRSINGKGSSVMTRTPPRNGRPTEHVDQEARQLLHRSEPDRFARGDHLDPAAEAAAGARDGLELNHEGALGRARAGSVTHTARTMRHLPREVLREWLENG